MRDLLLGLEPKDFDIATNAHPEQVRRLFRNCRLIGRRFHLAHVRFGQEIVEVATFRAAHTEIDEDHGVDETGHRVLDEHGRILRDNLYGTIEEDVWRRDFTANALYYNIEDFSIWDYVGGVPDARDRVLRMIGDPETRYREDPVRMLRAARFAAQAGLHAAPGLRRTDLPPGLHAGQRARGAALRRDDEADARRQGHAVLRTDVPTRPARAPDARRGRARCASSRARSVRACCGSALEGTDARVAEDKTVTPSFLFAVLLWPAILREAGVPGGPLPADPQQAMAACDVVLSRQLRRLAIPKRFSLPMRDIIAMQSRFERRAGRRALRLLDHPRFRAAYDFFCLRASSGEVDPALADWWTRLQEMPEDARIAEVEGLPSEPAPAGGRRRSRRRRRSPAA